jgi:hypothetical protein
MLLAYIVGCSPPNEPGADLCVESSKVSSSEAERILTSAVATWVDREETLTDTDIAIMDELGLHTGDPEDLEDYWRVFGAPRFRATFRGQGESGEFEFEVSIYGLEPPSLKGLTGVQADFVDVSTLFQHRLSGDTEATRLEFKDISQRLDGTTPAGMAAWCREPDPKESCTWAPEAIVGIGGFVSLPAIVSSEEPGMAFHAELLGTAHLADNSTVDFEAICLSTLDYGVP